jgi:integrase
MFNLAIDSKLRGCDVVSLRVEDVAPHGHAVDRATVRQKKTGQPVRFEMTEQTREAVDSYIGATRKKPSELLFSGRRGRDRPITTRQYARLVCQWIASVGLDGLVARIGRLAARSGRYRRVGPFDPGQSPCHSKRTRIAVITSRSSGTE